MKTEKKIMSLLEWLHPVLIMALICPFMYTFFRERRDGAMLPLYLGGFVLVLCSCCLRPAAVRITSLWGYLAICAGSMAAVLALAWLAGGRFLGGNLRIAYAIAMAAGSAWMMADACRIRMREKRRRKAHEDNDISFTDYSVFLEKPQAVCLCWFAIVYFSGCMTANPVLCDAALVSGLLYGLLFLVYCYLDSTREYLSETFGIINVPAGKIRRLRLGVFAALLTLVCMAALPSLLTNRQREYRDLRYQEFSFEMEPVGELMTEPEAAQGMEELMEWLTENTVTWDLPEWVDRLATVFMALVMAGFAMFVIRGIFRFFSEFRGAPEENGDVAQALDEDRTVRLERSFPGLFSGRLSWREKIRRNYRRTIRRYRKDRPSMSESPTQIEDGASFPAGFDRDKLHVEYEKARYGE